MSPFSLMHDVMVVDLVLLLDVVLVAWLCGYNDRFKFYDKVIFVRLLKVRKAEANVGVMGSGWEVDASCELRKAGIILSEDLGALSSEGAAGEEKRCRKTEAGGAGTACGSRIDNPLSTDSRLGIQVGCEARAVCFGRLP